jgi:hypothetical protein
MGRKNSLIFGQVLVNLDIAPDLATVVDIVNVKLGSLDSGEVEVSEDARGLVYEASEVAVGGCEVQQAVNREIWDNIVEYESVE